MLQLAVVLEVFTPLAYIKCEMTTQTCNPNKRNMTATKANKWCKRPFNDKIIMFDAFVNSIKSAPEIVLKAADLKTAQRGLWAVTEDDNEATAHMPVCVYMHAGKHMVLCNFGKVAAFLEGAQSTSTIKVRLISKQLLKHMETISIPADKQNAEAEKIERQIVASRQDDFEARRYADRPQSRTYQPREENGNSRPPQRPNAQKRFG